MLCCLLWHRCTSGSSAPVLRRYEEGGNVSLVSELEELGQKLGLQGVGQALQHGNYRAEVVAEDTAAKRE